MRNFRREEQTAASLERDLPAADFSWSLSRHILFRKCPFACFIHYYLTQGGWDPYADSLIRMAYREKQLRSYPVWLSREMHRAVGSALMDVRRLSGEERKRSVFLNHLKAHLISQLEVAVSREEQSVDGDVRPVGFLEGSFSPDFLYWTSEKHLFRMLEFLSGTDTLRILLTLFDGRRISPSFPMEAFFDGFPIHLEEGIHWTEPRTLCSLRFLFSEFDQERMRMEADVFAWCALCRWKRRDTLMIFHAAPPDMSSSVREILVHGDPVRAAARIKSDSNAMRKRIRHGKVVRGMDFERNISDANCSSCRFRMTCSALFETE